MNDPTINVQLSEDEMVIIANSLSCELIRVSNIDINSPYKKELERIYNKIKDKNNEEVIERIYKHLTDSEKKKLFLRMKSND